MPNKHYTFKVKALAYLLLILVFFLSGEIITRILFSFNKKHVLIPPYDNAIKDELLGWKMKPNYTFNGLMKDSEYQTYPVHLEYDQNGFKAFGNIYAKKPKVFFIGDSYTSCIEVSNKKSYFNLIGDSLNVEVFAYGQAGYGTLQEYLVFDKFIDVIQPDMIVWQVCTNDFIDNFYELEMLSGYKVGERRPYLEKNGHLSIIFHRF